ncbi:MAG: hypothetical protein K2P79_00110, partial [Sphingomonas sp.]|nr:hypothetical protein [Sphingomonas sp.]
AALDAIRQLQESAQDATLATHLLADEVRGDAGKLSRAFEAGENQLKRLGGAAETSSIEVARLANETAKLNATATEASAMLGALGDLIESVERFVKPTVDAE